MYTPQPSAASQPVFSAKITPDFVAVRKYPQNRADERRNGAEIRPIKWLEPAWTLGKVVFLKNTPKLKTRYPQKYPRQRVDSIVPSWTVKEKKYFVISEL
jgi:hypothetical protein